MHAYQSQYHNTNFSDTFLNPLSAQIPKGLSNAICYGIAESCIFKLDTYNNFLLEGDDGGLEMVDLDVFLSESLEKLLVQGLSIILLLRLVQLASILSSLLGG